MDKEKWRIGNFSLLLFTMLLIVFFAATILSSSSAAFSPNSSVGKKHGEQISIASVDESYIPCYCPDLARLSGAAFHNHNPLEDRKITVYCECVCNYSFIQDKQNYLQGIYAPCSWS